MTLAKIAETDWEFIRPANDSIQLAKVDQIPIFFKANLFIFH
jgi:hypothetical protein